MELPVFSNNLDYVLSELRAKEWAVPEGTVEHWPAALQLPVVHQPLGSMFESELWLTGVVKSMADCRSASADWMGIIQVREMLQHQLTDIEVQLAALSLEERNGKLFLQSQLEDQALINRAALDQARIVLERSQSIWRHNKNAEDSVHDMIGKIARINVHRDTAPPPAENWHRQNHAELFGQLDPAGNPSGLPEEYYVTAAQRMALHGRQEAEIRNNQDVLIAEKQVALLESVIDVIERQVEDIKAQIAGVDLRIGLVQQQQTRLRARLQSEEIDFVQRTAGVIARYLLASKTLAYRVDKTRESFAMVFGDQAPARWLSHLQEHTRFDNADRGARLELAEYGLRNIQAWLGAVNQNSTRRSRLVEITLHPEGGGVAGKGLLEGAVGRVRGIRLFAGTEPLVCKTVRITPPHGTEMVLPMTSITKSADTAVISTRELWNRQPAGEWSLAADLLAPAGDAMSMFLEVMWDDGVVVPAEEHLLV